MTIVEPIKGASHDDITVALQGVFSYVVLRVQGQLSITLSQLILRVQQNRDKIGTTAIAAGGVALQALLHWVGLSPISSLKVSEYHFRWLGEILHRAKSWWSSTLVEDVGEQHPDIKVAMDICISVQLADKGVHFGCCRDIRGTGLRGACQTESWL